MMRLPAAVLLLIAGTAVGDDAAAKKMLKDLEGSYAPAVMKSAGEAIDDALLKDTSFTIKGDTFVFRYKMKDKTEEKQAVIVLDPSQKPAAIDLTPKEGPDASRPMLGIVKIEKDAVTLCWSDRRDKPERPKEFTSTKANGYFLIVMKKARD
jgi:uncharacterized protein (TIGR03067 family)